MENRESLDIDVLRYVLMFKRQWKPASLIFAITVIISVIATRFIKPSYEASGKLLFRTPAFQVVEGQNAVELRTLVPATNPINNQIQLIFSTYFLEQIIEQLNLKDETGQRLSTDEIGKNLTLKIIGGTDVLRVNYYSYDPEKAAAIVNKVMSFYLENDILLNTSEAVATRDFFTNQIPKSRANVNLAALELRNFKQQNNIVDIAEETRSNVAIIGNLNNEINSVQAELEDFKAQSDTLRQQINMNSEEGLLVTSISQSPAIQELLNKLQEIDIDLATERGRFLDDHPIIIRLEEKKAMLRNVLEQEIEKNIGSQIQLDSQSLQIGVLKQNLIQNFLQSQVQYIGLSQRLASLNQSRSLYENRMRIIPQLSQKQHDLERKLELAESAYQTILRQIQDLQLAANKNTANGRIIAKALTPTYPISGKQRLFVLVGAMFGVFFATTTVFLIELRDSSLKTLKEITNIYKYTLLGIIPLSGKNFNSREVAKKSESSEVVVRDQPYSFASEMYQMTQANLRLLSSDKAIKTIVISSSVANEGTSTVSANLATTLGQLGKKVLLVDANMRISSQHSFWKLPNLTGLSELLVSEAKLHNVSYQVMPNIDVLTAGRRPPNPLALIDSKRMAALIEEFSTQYDYVIIDTPPLLIGADALTLSQMTDGILLVARPGVVDYSGANAVREMLKSPKYNVLGLLVNGVIEQNESSNYFYRAQEYYQRKAEGKRNEAGVRKYGTAQDLMIEE
ncbi:GumC family protein [Nodularia sphaerocarpa]|uniref:GumC family protein n=1 Tax=Nodularia sphaerocarpa TaxID=137816 RepID=UPI001EFB545D|nr:polysaccharide biosynthesis tyrosine autokinase [Nodularia sphaerocarpa]MDB9374855.1 polysaccharide biosynthesis tyrosine autokinase [Nodularia sphaerocarpa CS-585]MDB9378875.1 polysaccharide biosynthesis tyrosine autokinase [Nodularia sphaerocarpa CS-585A2]ULP70484.1 Tyrosine-protein kinase YwqD [Nodularia sphaerocarpa UHCC 0038]